jgi:hypothetical protein
MKMPTKTCPKSLHINPPITYRAKRESDFDKIKIVYDPKIILATSAAEITSFI